MAARPPKKISVTCPRCGGSGEVDQDGLSTGDLIVSRRLAMGWTQQQLADKIEMSRGTVANVEVNRADLSLKALAKFAEAFGCSQKDLVP